MRRAYAGFPVLVLLIACGDAGRSELRGSSGGGGASNSSSTDSSSGASSNSGGQFIPGAGGGTSSSNGGATNCGSELVGIVRDFQSSHPDFEAELGVDPGIVETDLGADLKPVYAGDTPTTHGQVAFDQWYRDVPGVNLAIPLAIQLVENQPGVYTFDNGDFFPIDGQGFGDEGNAHNYHFTYEIHAEFTYEGGEVFTFTGDDDLFTFINKKLAIDLGGTHPALSTTIDLDAIAGALGISVGNVYPMDIFHAERHTSESNFRIQTTIACFQPPIN